MATCDITKLVPTAGDFGKVTHSPLITARLTLLCQILKALSPVATCDVKTLMARASTFGRVTQNPREMIELQLLCEIQAVAGSGGGGGGGGGQIVAYTAANPNVQGVTPNNVNNPAIAVKPGSAIWVWNTATQLWQ